MQPSNSMLCSRMRNAGTTCRQSRKLLTYSMHLIHAYKIISNWIIPFQQGLSWSNLLVLENEYLFYSLDVISRLNQIFDRQFSIRAKWDALSFLLSNSLFSIGIDGGRTLWEVDILYLIFKKWLISISRPRECFSYYSMIHEQNHS